MYFRGPFTISFHFIFHTIENVIICNSEPYTRENFFCYFDSDIDDKAIFFNSIKKLCYIQQPMHGGLRDRNEWSMLKLAKREKENHNELWYCKRPYRETLEEIALK